MDEVEYDIRQLVSRLRTAHVKGYLLSQGWEEKHNRYVDQLYFQGKTHEGGEAYELYFPASTGGARYQTLVMRAIYKLCGIEDREPAEITRDMLASPIAVPQAGVSTGVARLRVRSSDSRPLHLEIDSPRAGRQLAGPWKPVQMPPDEGPAAGDTATAPAADEESSIEEVEAREAAEAENELDALLVGIAAEPSGETSATSGATAASSDDEDLDALLSGLAAKDEQQPPAEEGEMDPDLAALLADL